ncbi:MAG: tetratricopeptide repeat protein [Raineya sp.]|nr:tetratricopeptide repeat protein [Raineya sp.]
MKKFGLLFLVCIFSYVLQAQSIQQGLQYMDMEQFSSAKKVFEQLVSSKPTAEHYYYLGYFYAKTGDADQAQAQFEKGLQADKKFALNEIGLAEVKLMKGDKAGAKAIIDEVIKKTKSKDYNVLLRAGEAYISHEAPNQDPFEAIKILEEAIKHKNATEDAYIFLGDAYTFTKKSENGPKAIANYDFAITKSNRKSGKALTKRIEFNLFGKNPDYTDILREYKEIMRTNPDYTPIYRKIAELYSKARKLDSAIAYYDKYMARSEKSDEVRYRYAIFLYKTDKFDKALQELKAMEGKVKYPEFNRWMAYALQKNGKSAEAQSYMGKVLQSGIKLFPSDYECLADIAFTNKNNSEAYANLRKAYELNPDDEEAIYYIRRIADSLYSEKRYTEAGKTFEEVIEKNKLNKKQFGIENYVYSGFAYMLSKENYDKADEMFAKGYQKYPEYVKFLIYRANNRLSQNSNDINDKALAKEHYEAYLAETDKLLEKAQDKEKELAKYRKDRAAAYNYMMGYYFAKKDLPKAKEFAQKIIDEKNEGDLAKKADDLLKLKAIPEAKPATNKPTKPAPKTGANKPK